MIRAIFILASVLSIFFFPYPATLLLSFLASLFLPVIGVATGALVEIIYATPQATSYPIGLLLGAAASAAALLIRRFVKARVALS